MGYLLEFGSHFKLGKENKFPQRFTDNMKAVYHQAKARALISFDGVRIQLESFEYTKVLIAPPEQQHRKTRVVKGIWPRNKLTF